MAKEHRVMSTVLLLLGVALVFAGISGAFDFTMTGIVASAAAVAGLLYAGAMWFGRTRVDESALIYTHDLRIASGAHAGRRLLDLFPEPMHRDLEACCREALLGQARVLRYQAGSLARRFEAAPVHSGDGLIVYGILLSGAMLPAAASRRLTPVA